MRATARLGIMGGTFDPIHYGHLVTAEEALFQFELDRVIFMPTGDPASKGRDDVTSSEHRYLMTSAAIASNPHFEVSRMEIDRTGPTYAVDTLEELRARHGASTDLFFITGADAVWEILTWKDPERVVSLTRFIAATRPGYDLTPFLDSDIGRVVGDRVHFMEVPALAISSTDIRGRVASHRPVRYLLPEAVAAYIHENGLYREDV